MRKQNKELEQRIVDSFENIRLVVERTDLLERHETDEDHNTTYLLGRQGFILAEANPSSEGELRLVDKGNSYVWGCVKSVKDEFKDRWHIDPSTFTITPTKGYTPVQPNDFSGDVDMQHQLKYHRKILSFRVLNEAELEFIEQARAKKQQEENRRAELKGMVPRVGQEIYVPTELYLSHGRDDKIGGIAAVAEVRKEDRDYWVTVREVKGGYNWTNYLAENQDKWKEEYGNQRASPDPDLSPEFNEP